MMVVSDAPKGKYIDRAAAVSVATDCLYRIAFTSQMQYYNAGVNVVAEKLKSLPAADVISPDKELRIALAELDAYRAIGTVSECRKAVETMAASEAAPKNH